MESLSKTPLSRAQAPVLSRAWSGAAAKQQGITLVMTMVILVVMTLSSLAMIVAMRSGINAAGNIAFRQAAVRAADVGVQDAFEWMNTALTNADALNVNIPASGYFASSDFATNCMPDSATDDSTTLPVERVFKPDKSWAPQWNFSNNQCAVSVGQVGDYQLYYVIHRMAETYGACENPVPAGQIKTICMVPPATVVDWVPKAGDSQAGGRGKAFSRTNQFVYYRITVKVVGPRNNTRYVQSFVY